MLPFIVCIPVLNRFEECNNLIHSIREGTLQPASIEVLDNSGGKFIPEDDTVQVTISEENIGVARSFNYFLDLGLNEFPNCYVVISNDDLVLYPDTLEALVAGIEADPNRLIYCSDLHGANSFSFFCVKPKQALETVGWFEIAYHSYLEDSDWMYRARLLGHELIPVQGCRIKDHVGSGTLKAFTEEEETAFHNRRAFGIEAYRKKWGSLPDNGGEIYTKPYNGSIDAVTWHREKFKRVHPYEI